MSTIYVLEQILFLLPMILSLIAAVLCVQALSQTHRSEADCDILFICVLSALLLLTIHVTGAVTHFHKQTTIGVFQILWVMYNSLIMFALIIFARP